MLGASPGMTHPAAMKPNKPDDPNDKDKDKDKKNMPGAMGGNMMSGMNGCM